MCKGGITVNAQKVVKETLSVLGVTYRECDCCMFYSCACDCEYLLAPGFRLADYYIECESDGRIMVWSFVQNTLVNVIEFSDTVELVSQLTFALIKYGLL